MKSCGECGASISGQSNAHAAQRRYECVVCGTTHYQNSRVIVSCEVDVMSEADMATTDFAAPVDG